MATLTAFSSAEDGYVQSQNATYATARTGGTLSVATTGDMFIGQQTVYNCFEGFVDFDTSSIPDTDVVSTATLSLYGSVDSSVTDFTLEARSHDWGAGDVTTADWVSGADLGSKTLAATFATSGFATGAYNDFVSDAGFPGLIDKTGETRLVIVSDRHRLGTTPTTDEFVRVSSADVAGTTQDPKLVVVHNPAAAPQTHQMVI